MKEYEIKFSDFQRILIGEVPYYFYVEVIFRVIVIYLILMLAMRLMGKRMSAQLSRNEMAAVASLAAAIGVPLMNPDRGLLPAVVIAVVIIIYQVFIAKKASADKKFESLTQDKYNMLVKDGVLNPGAMFLTNISRERLLSQLRAEGITHLGMVRRMYFEAGGTFSILRMSESQPGLAILPGWDKDVLDEVYIDSPIKICAYCGNSQAADQETSVCPNCKSKKWVVAVENRESQLEI